MQRGNPFSGCGLSSANPTPNRGNLGFTDSRKTITRGITNRINPTAEGSDSHFTSSGRASSEGRCVSKNNSKSIMVCCTRRPNDGHTSLWEAEGEAAGLVGPLNGPEETSSVHHRSFQPPGLEVACRACDPSPGLGRITRWLCTTRFTKGDNRGYCR